MKFSALLDVTMVAHETDDEVTLLLDLAAPPAPEASVERPPSSLQVVLDRSGSMAGGGLDGAVRALEALVARLDAEDNFGVVAFDDQATVVVPAGPLTDKQRVVQQLRAVGPGGMTDLSSGYLRGLQEVKRMATDAGGTLLVISDGHVNRGLQDVGRFGEVAAEAHRQGVVTSTLGYGLGYDETLLAAIARSGTGNHHFAEDPDAAGALIASEVDHLLTKTVQAVSLTIRFSPLVELVRLYNDLPAQQIGDGQVMVEVGDFYADEARKLLLRLKVPAMAALGLAQVATLELRYVELPGLVEQVVTIPVTVNVVPGDQAAGRVPDPVVRTEVLFQEAQQLKKAAGEAMANGDRDAARAALSDARTSLWQASAVAPPEIRGDVAREVQEVAVLVDELRDGDLNRTSKRTAESFHRQSRKRGRGPDSPRSS